MSDTPSWAHLRKMIANRSRPDMPGAKRSDSTDGGPAGRGGGATACGSVNDTIRLKMRLKHYPMQGSLLQVLFRFVLAESIDGVFSGFAHAEVEQETLAGVLNPLAR